MRYYTHFLLFLCVILIVIQATPVLAQANDKEVVANISTWGGLGLIGGGASAIFVGEELALGASFAGAGVYSFLVGGIPFFLGNEDVFAIANTIAGATTAGVALLGPFLPYLFLPLAFIIDTVFTYGPVTDYNQSIGMAIIDGMGPVILNIGEIWYGNSSMWAATLPAIVWLLGTGITGLAIDNGQVTTSDEPALTPLLSPSYIGLSIQY